MPGETRARTPENGSIRSRDREKISRDEAAMLARPPANRATIATTSKMSAPVEPRAPSRTFVIGTVADVVAPRSRMLIVRAMIMKKPITTEITRDVTTAFGTLRRAPFVSSARSAAPSKPVRTQIPSSPDRAKATRKPLSPAVEVVRKLKLWTGFVMNPTTSRIRVRTIDRPSSAVNAAMLLIRDAIRTPARLISS